MRVLFIDDRVRDIIRQWQESGCARSHELLPPETFDSIERACQMVVDLVPDICLVAAEKADPDGNLFTGYSLRLHRTLPKLWHSDCAVRKPASQTFLERSTNLQ